MSVAVQRIEETREALLGALERRDWAAIAELDMACRHCIDSLRTESEGTPPEVDLRPSLEKLLFVYKDMLDAATEERHALFQEVTQIRQARNAAKVYHLYS